MKKINWNKFLVPRIWRFATILFGFMLLIFFFGFLQSNSNSSRSLDVSHQTLINENIANADRDGQPEYQNGYHVSFPTFKYTLGNDLVENLRYARLGHWYARYGADYNMRAELHLYYGDYEQTSYGNFNETDWSTYYASCSWTGRATVCQSYTDIDWKFTVYQFRLWLLEKVRALQAADDTRWPGMNTAYLRLQYIVDEWNNNSAYSDRRAIISQYQTYQSSVLDNPYTYSFPLGLSTNSFLPNGNMKSAQEIWSQTVDPFLTWAQVEAIQTWTEDTAANGWVRQMTNDLSSLLPTDLPTDNSLNTAIEAWNNNISPIHRQEISNYLNLPEELKNFLAFNENLNFWNLLSLNENLFTSNGHLKSIQDSVYLDYTVEEKALLATHINSLIETSPRLLYRQAILNYWNNDSDENTEGIQRNAEPTYLYWFSQLPLPFDNPQRILNLPHAAGISYSDFVTSNPLEENNFFSLNNDANILSTIREIAYFSAWIEGLTLNSMRDNPNFNANYQTSLFDNLVNLLEDDWNTSAALTNLRIAFGELASLSSLPSLLPQFESITYTYNFASSPFTLTFNLDFNAAHFESTTGELTVAGKTTIFENDANSPSVSLPSSNLNDHWQFFSLSLFARWARLNSQNLALSLIDNYANRITNDWNQTIMANKREQMGIYRSIQENNFYSSLAFTSLNFPFIPSHLAENFLFSPNGNLVNLNEIANTLAQLSQLQYFLEDIDVFIQSLLEKYVLAMTNYWNSEIEKVSALAHYLISPSRNEVFLSWPTFLSPSSFEEDGTITESSLLHFSLRNLYEINAWMHSFELIEQLTLKLMSGNIDWTQVTTLFNTINELPVAERNNYLENYRFALIQAWNNPPSFLELNNLPQLMKDYFFISEHIPFRSSYFTALSFPLALQTATSLENAFILQTGKLKANALQGNDFNNIQKLFQFQNWVETLLSPVSEGDSRSRIQFHRAKFFAAYQSWFIYSWNNSSLYAEQREAWANYASLPDSQQTYQFPGHIKLNSFNFNSDGTLNNLNLATNLEDIFILANWMIHFFNSREFPFRFESPHNVSLDSCENLLECVQKNWINEWNNVYLTHHLPFRYYFALPDYLRPRHYPAAFFTIPSLNLDVSAFVQISDFASSGKIRNKNVFANVENENTFAEIIGPWMMNFSYSTHANVFLRTLRNSIITNWNNVHFNSRKKLAIATYFANANSTLYTGYPAAFKLPSGLFMTSFASDGSLRANGLDNVQTWNELWAIGEWLKDLNLEIPWLNKNDRLVSPTVILQNELINLFQAWNNNSQYRQTMKWYKHLGSEAFLVTDLVFPNGLSLSDFDDSGYMISISGLAEFVWFANPPSSRNVNSTTAIQFVSWENFNLTHSASQWDVFFAHLKEIFFWINNFSSPQHSRLLLNSHRNSLVQEWNSETQKALALQNLIRSAKSTRTPIANLPAPFDLDDFDENGFILARALQDKTLTFDQITSLRNWNVNFDTPKKEIPLARTLIIFGSLSGGVLILCVIGGTIFWWRKKNKKL